MYTPIAKLFCSSQINKMIVIWFIIKQCKTSWLIPYFLKIEAIMFNTQSGANESKQIIESEFPVITKKYKGGHNWH